MVLGNPWSRLTFGSHLRSLLASVISGWRTLGSSSGRGLKTTFDLLPVISMTFRASCSTVISFGLPTLMGPVSWLMASR
jgi:hypothetical protein